MFRSGYARTSTRPSFTSHRRSAGRSFAARNCSYVAPGFLRMNSSARCPLLSRSFPLRSFAVARRGFAFATSSGTASAYAAIRFRINCSSQASACATIVSMSSYCGVQSSVWRILSAAAIITGTSPARARAGADVERHARDFLHRVEKLQHRIAAAVAAIQHQAFAAAVVADGRAPRHARATRSLTWM